MLEACEQEDRILLQFEGRLDTARSMEMEAEVRKAVTGATMPVVFDLERVDFVSSYFLRFCLYAHHQAGSHGFQIVGAGPAIKRVFKIAGLDAMLQGD